MKPKFHEVKHLLNKEMLDRYFTIDVENGKFFYKDLCHKKENYFQEIIMKDSDDYRKISIKLGNHWYVVPQHKLMWFYVKGYWPNLLDHVDTVRDNNRISNLRECDTSGNNRNRKVGRKTTTGLKNIYFNKDMKKYHVRVGRDSKHVHIGYYDNIDEAVVARDKAIDEIHGEFGRK